MISHAPQVHGLKQGESLKVIFVLYIPAVLLRADRTTGAGLLGARASPREPAACPGALQSASPYDSVRDL